MSDETKRAISMLVFYLILCVGTAFSARFIAESLTNNSAAGNQVYNYEEHVSHCDYMPKGQKYMYVTLYRDGYPIGKFKAVKYTICTTDENGYMVTGVSITEANGRVYLDGGQEISYYVSSHK